MAEAIRLFSTTWCGHCRRLKRQLDDAGIAYEEIDIDEERQYGDRIVAKSGGYRVVPTVEVAGDLLINPSLEEVREALVGAPAPP